MLHLEWLWERKNRPWLLLASAVLVAGIAIFDWLTKPYFSLGFLYLFPIMLAAGFLPRWAIALLGIVCAALAETFSFLDPADAHIRLVVFAVALCGSGLFLSEVLRNRRLRLTAQEQVRVLVETSPAPIVTIDANGFIELANQAAAQLLTPVDGDLIGLPIAAFM
ncbi:MAG TPA: PAS domain-containing protein, partial [Terriglobales bacterium]|nr:PAS domain-containing protein [Terriglobales bacterium]